MINIDKIYRDSFIFYRSFLEAIETIENESDQAKIMLAIIRYALDEKEPELSGYLQGFFKLVKPQLDANIRKFQNGCKGREYGKLGGRPKKQNRTGTPTKPQQNRTETRNDNVNDNVNVNLNESKRKCNKEKEEPFSLIEDSDLPKNKTDSLRNQLVLEINTLFHRRPTTGWTDKELKALEEISKRPDVLQELEEIKALYNSGYEYQRQDVKTFLNNWTTELDRSRNNAMKDDDPYKGLIGGKYKVKNDGCNYESGKNLPIVYNDDAPF